MRFYHKQHRYYCGIDLHTRNMYMCVQDQAGDIQLHQNMRAKPLYFLNFIEPFLPDVVVGVECMFTWYWLADLCAQEGIPFILGHALYMKAIHGGKAKNDRIDAYKISSLIRGGNFPIAYVYPAHMRSTRDLLRRRMLLVRHRAALLSHIKNTNHQLCLEPFGTKISCKTNRDGIEDRFVDPSVKMSITVDRQLIDTYDTLVSSLERFILNTAKEHDPQALYLLQSVPGIGKILALVVLYEVHDIDRFASVQKFASYARLIKCQRQSDGKVHGTQGAKIGNAHLKWAFSEASVTFLRNNPAGQKLLARIERKHSKPKALSILAHKLGRTVYYMMKRRRPFDSKRFYGN